MAKLRRPGPWSIPLLFAVLMASVGAYAYRELEQATRAQLANELETLLQADVKALGVWVETQRSIARAIAGNASLRAPVQALLEGASQSRDPREALRAHPAGAVLQEVLLPETRELGYRNFVVLDRGAMVLADRDGALVGRRLTVGPEHLEALLAGDTVFYRAVRNLTGEGGAALLETTTFHAAAPIRSAAGDVVALLGFAIPSDGAFSEILTVARMGESGETYAFDEQGRMLSQSRFEDQLVALGLLPEDPAARVSSTVQIRDPGGNLLEGHEPGVPLRARPLTRMAADAVTGNSGSDVVGYRDYRGVDVVGAWTWLPNLSMGITTEIDVAEAYVGLYTLRRVFASLAVLLALAALGMALYSVLLGRLQRRFDRARQLGRYRIVEKIGEGGMGKVYRARHALLRRPTAVKVLAAEHANKEAVVRFEREVQSASALTHPNTIAIYDYGHTPDGSFYYAMEYLEGCTVGDLVSDDGAQPEARVVHLMRQTAASLAEAHATGLIHRDLKPSNVMLCRRGGLWDFVKVLDFGLVRSEAQSGDLALTSVDSLTGTPLYMSPEALESPDSMSARSDVYQLGALAYYLLAGEHVFTGNTMVEVLSQHLHSEPEPPSKRLGQPVSPELEELVLACLAKRPEDRPADGAALLEALERGHFAGTWTQREAGIWWEAWQSRHPTPSDGDRAASGSSLPSGWQVDLEGRSRWGRS